MSAPDELWVSADLVGHVEEAEGDIRYIRAPDSAPNGLVLADVVNAAYADEDGCTRVSNMLPNGWRASTIFGSDEALMAFAQRIVALARNQPGGAVPRGEPVAWRWWESQWNEYRYCEDQNPYRDCEPLYTKAGEGETPATDERERG